MSLLDPFDYFRSFCWTSCQTY